MHCRVVDGLPFDAPWLDLDWGGAILRDLQIHFLSRLWGASSGMSSKMSLIIETCRCLCASGEVRRFKDWQPVEKSREALSMYGCFQP